MNHKSPQKLKKGIADCQDTKNRLRLILPTRLYISINISDLSHVCFTDYQ